MPLPLKRWKTPFVECKKQVVKVIGAILGGVNYYDILDPSKRLTFSSFPLTSLTYRAELQRGRVGREQAFIAPS